jgi:hypothetical protein
MPTPAGTICEGLQQSSDTELDFFNATVKESTLHLSGGELRYGNIGIIDGEAVDLMVTSSDYTHPNGNVNGIRGLFGRIGAVTLGGDPESGKANFDFCFVENNTYTPVTASSFQW